MKILYYSPHPHLNLQDLSGYGTHIREMIAAFRELGHEVLPLIAGGVEKNAEKKNNSTGNSTRYIKNVIPSLWWETMKDISLLKKDKSLENLLLEKIDSFKPDIIYERGNYLQLSGCRAAQKRNIRHIVEINAPYPEERRYMQGISFLSFLAEKAERKQTRSSTGIVVVSSALKNYLMEKHKIPSEKIIITPNAINVKDVKTNPVKVEEIRTALNLVNHTVIGFTGSIFPYHGVDKLVKAFNAVLKKIHSCKLLIVGDGETLPLLKNLAKESGISDNIIFTGNIDRTEVFNYMEAMDICVMPDSNWYGSPVKIFEYGFLGKPVIAPDYGPLRDVMENNVNGVLIKPGVENLAGALLKLIADKQMGKKMGENFRKKVTAEHTWKNMAKKILSGQIKEIPV